MDQTFSVASSIFNGYDFWIVNGQNPIGHRLDEILVSIANFLLRYPGEVIFIEINPVDRETFELLDGLSKLLKKLLGKTSPILNSYMYIPCVYLNPLMKVNSYTQVDIISTEIKLNP